MRGRRSTVLEWPASGTKTQGLIDGPAGRLEVEVTRPKGDSSGLAVICHPHPQQGGTKDNKVVFMLARAATDSGLSAVRFNFRGVGDSQGRFDQGRGENDDARAVLAWALAESGAPLALIAGFSFGAAVALRLADANPPPALVTVGLPADYFAGTLPRPETRWLALYGGDDDVIDGPGAIAALQALTPPPDIALMTGAGHFLHGRLSELRTRVKQHLAKGPDE